MVDMLEEKLLEAKEKNKKKRKRLTLFFLAAAGCCALLIYGVTAVTVAWKSTPTETDEITTEVSLISEQSDNADNADDAGKKFIEMLGDYEETIETELNKINLQSWNKEKYHEITDLKAQALANFHVGQYKEATHALTQLRTLSDKLITQAGKIFDDAMRQAETAYRNDQYDAAKQHIEKALILNTESEDALNLQAKIEALTEILPLLKAIKIADKENNKQQELALIRQALAIDPDRTDLAARKTALSQKIKEESFAELIAQTLNAITQKQVNEAEQKIAAAAEIYPGRFEVAEMQRQINDLKKDLRVQNALTNAEAAIAEDNWKKVISFLQAALKELPNDGAVTDQLNAARRILELNDMFKIYIDDPYKLANDKVYKKIQQAVDASEKFTALSPSLHRQRNTTVANLEKMNATIPVNIISDGKTYISVRGVGKIGATQQKTIHLKPGTYIFEGQRRGFKAKLLKQLIPMDHSSLSLTIICNEPV